MPTTKQLLTAEVYATTVAYEPVQAVQSTQLAVKHALSGERGPVAVIFHSRSLGGTVGPGSRPTLYPTQRYLPPKSHGDPAHVAEAAAALADARRPVIVAGNGVRIGQAYRELRELVEAAGGSGSGTHRTGHHGGRRGHLQPHHLPRRHQPAGPRLTRRGGLALTGAPAMPPRRCAHLLSRSQPAVATGTGCRGTRTRIRPPTRNRRAMLSTPMLVSPVICANTPTRTGPRMAANLPHIL